MQPQRRAVSITRNQLVCGQVTANSKPSPEGVRIRRQRLKLRLTQEGLARKVGVTTHTIWRLENDPVCNARLETLRAIARALEVDVTYFFSASGDAR
jgi:transcriptional regulator with XRE-family HTH domain